MNSVKLSKKRPFIIVILTLVLLFSLNLNVFAINEQYIEPVTSTYQLSYWDYDSFSEDYYNISSSDVSVVHSSSVDSIFGRPYSKFSFPILNTTSCYIDAVSYPIQISAYDNLNYSFAFKADFPTNINSFYVYIIARYQDYNGLNLTSKSILLNDFYSFNNWISFDYTFTNFPSDAYYLILELHFEYWLTDKTTFYPTFYIGDNLTNFNWTEAIPTTPIPTPDTSHIDGTLNNLNTVEGELPKVDKEQLADLMNFDFSQFTGSLSFIRSLFERTMDTFNFNAVLIFALTIGLAAYVIGRKVK